MSAQLLDGKIMAAELEEQLSFSVSYSSSLNKHESL